MAADAVTQTVSGKSYDATVLAPEDAWIAKFASTSEAFKADVKELGKTLAEQQGPEDMAHLRKIIRWQRFCVWFGTLTCWYCINPISIYLISLGCMARWTMIGHHVCHGGYDKCSKGEFNRFKFGVGSLYQRCVDWLDWMLVEAWNVEHNQLHHYCLGEDLDPDLVEQNFRSLRDTPGMPLWVKYAGVYLSMGVWKWCAPSPLAHMRARTVQRALFVVVTTPALPLSSYASPRALSAQVLLRAEHIQAAQDPRDAPRGQGAHLCGRHEGLRRRYGGAVANRPPLVLRQSQR